MSKKTEKEIVLERRRQRRIQAGKARRPELFERRVIGLKEIAGYSESYDFILGSSKPATPADRLIRFAGSYVGSPYMPQSTKIECTPANRKKIYDRNQGARLFIKEFCPVLSGVAADCYTAKCKWYNHDLNRPIEGFGPWQYVLHVLRFMYPRLFTDRVESFGDMLSNEGAISYRGYIYTMPLDVVGVVYTISQHSGNITRVGIYDGRFYEDDNMGYVYYMRSAEDGVVKEPFAESEWSHWGLFHPIYKGESIEAITSLVMAMEEHVKSYSGRVSDGVVDVGGSEYTLNIRKGPTVSAPITATVNHGEGIVVLDIIEGEDKFDDNGYRSKEFWPRGLFPHWYKVLKLVDDEEPVFGYAQARYIRLLVEEPKTE